MSKQYSKEVVDFVKENYPKEGSRFCAEHLGLTISIVSSMARRHNWYRTVFNPEDFINVKMPEMAYLLGYLWADGCVYKNSNRIGLGIAMEDLEKLENVFDFIPGDWKFHLWEKENPKHKDIGLMRLSNKELATHLRRHNYTTKNESACSILSTIPDHLKHYWFRGISDGDGCFYLKPELRLYQFVCTSEYKQDWTYFEKLFNNLNIRYDIRRKITLEKSGKTTRNSQIRTSGRKQVSRFGDYIYQNYETDKIGLPRKYEKYLLTINKSEKSNIIA